MKIIVISAARHCKILLQHLGMVSLSVRSLTEVTFKHLIVEITATARQFKNSQGIWTIRSGAASFLLDPSMHPFLRHLVLMFLYKNLFSGTLTCICQPTWRHDDESSTVYLSLYTLFFYKNTLYKGITSSCTPSSPTYKKELYII